MVGSVLTVIIGLLVASAPSASAEDSMTDLGAFAYGKLVVEADKVAVSINDRIVIADTTGEVKNTITGLSGAYGLAMTPDGTRLYAALQGTNEIAEIDTATAAIIRRVDLAAYPCPSELVLTGERLWVGYGGCGDQGVLNLDLSEATPEPSPFETPLKSAPLMAAAGDTLVLGEVVSPGDLFVYDIGGAAPVLRGEIDGHAHSNYGLNDLAVTPDGSQVISAFALPYSFDMWDARTLVKVRGYERQQFDGWPAGVAISSDGAYVAGVRKEGLEMTLYDAASGAAIYTADTAEGQPVSENVQFSGRDVFSLLRSPTDRLYLWRLHDVTLPASTLTLTAEPGGTAHQPLTLTGRLTLEDGTAPGAQPLAVTRTLSGGAGAELPSVTTAADGTFTITDTPPTGGENTYTVRWKGNDEHRWSKASVTIVVRYPTTLTLSGPRSGVAGQRLVFSGTLRAEGTTLPRSGRLTVQRTRNDEGGETVSWPVSIGTTGSYVFSDTPGAGQYTYTVQWNGDTRLGPAQAAQDVTVYETAR
ncbi:hypothetical protein GCM10022226_02140 [Sphaerisporangium flaviroseum]|uniref:40-residue YVTN family beta-propeller repeat-containing protein n=1 Tax=Sphaerisporangium flaviroseum TaxID=509199 RepID=A0ABP7H7U1_9ACTN